MNVVTKKMYLRLNFFSFYLYLCYFFITFAPNFVFFCVLARNRVYYNVAGHVFAVESSKLGLLSVMANYEPFLCPPSAASDLIFELRVAFDGLIADPQILGYNHLYTDNAEEDMPRVELYNKLSRGDQLVDEGAFGNWLIRVAKIAMAPICCDLQCDATFTKGELHIAEDCADIRFCIDNALMLMYAFRTSSLMTLEMHAAVVVKGDLGYLFLGHSGTGKSTHARQWLAVYEDAWLLNDDNPILRILDNGEVRVFGSPWSGKTPCYHNQSVPVKGIIKLSQAPYNKIRTLSLPEAYAYMLSSASGLKMNSKMADHMYVSIKHIITSVKMCHLECLPNVEAAKVCCGEMSE